MRFILIGLAMVSLPVFASCPQLAGQYTCTDASNNSSSPITITQSVQNNAAVYTLNNQMTIPADGETHPLPDTTFHNGTFTASCDNAGNLLVQGQGEFFWGSTDEGSVGFNAYASPNASGMSLAINYLFAPAAGGSSKSGAYDYTCVTAP